MALPRSAPPFAGFYFDCDSTLSTIEGVDELTRHLPDEVRAELAELTHRAMEGLMPLAEVYETRLHRIAPTKADLDRIGGAYIDNVVPDAASTIRALLTLGKHVGIISGGLLHPVRALGNHLGVDPTHVHAVPVLFEDDGSYRDFDRESPLWRNHGKIRVLERIPPDHRPIVFVGDGVTDLEAKDVVDLFVGFGGIETRARVKTEADVFLEDPSLAGVLRVGLTEEEKNRLRRSPSFGDIAAML